jgi:hypothetical protein
MQTPRPRGLFDLRSETTDLGSLVSNNGTEDIQSIEYESDSEDDEEQLPTYKGIPRSCAKADAVIANSKATDTVFMAIQ